MFVCIPPGKAVPEMTYTVSGGTLNPTHSLTFIKKNIAICNTHLCEVACIKSIKKFKVQDIQILQKNYGMLSIF